MVKLSDRLIVLVLLWYGGCIAVSLIAYGAVVVMAQPAKDSPYSQRPGETLHDISDKNRASPSPLKVLTSIAKHS